MSNILISILAVGTYVVAGALLAVQLTRQASSIGHRWILLSGVSAVILHAFLLYGNLFTDQGVNLGFVNVVSLLSWLIALLLLISSFSKPVENLGIAIYPFAAMAIILSGLFPSEHFLSGDNKNNLEIHILISILAYSLLSLAALQAILISIQDSHLRNKHPGGFIRTLPPLQTMESLLFQIIGLGFAFQSLSLVSGALYIDDLFAQHLIHKTVLSIVAWIIFAILLWGRWQSGWRGKTAIRWTLGGFVSLLLAYLGSKLVLEILLGY
ncbi:MAG: inner membrane protein YpjD [Gammaproteobacteria bacterium]